MHSPDKAELRTRLLAARSALSDEQIASARGAVRRSVIERCGQAGWRRVAAYMPLRTEPGSPELLEELHRLGVEVVVPHLLADRDLDWTRWPLAEPPELLGVDAVARVDVLLVPALAVSRAGTRLGRGGGSYDRALARATGALAVALLHDGELVGELPSDPWDRPVQAVVTPSGWQDLDG